MFFSFFRFSDLLVGAPRAFKKDEGRVFVYVNNKNVSSVSFFFFQDVFLPPSVGRPICPSSFIRLSVFLCVCLSIHIAVSLFVHSSACFSLSVLLSVCLAVCLPARLSFCLSANQFVTPFSLNYKNRPVVFSIPGCTQSSRRTWFNGWWHPVRSIWQSDSKGRGPEQRWLSRYIRKPYMHIEW